MKLYGVKYEDLTNGEPSWVDNDVHKSREAAERCAKQCADEMVADMNAAGDNEFAPYRVEVMTANGLPTFMVLDATSTQVEQWSVVEFNLVESYKNA